VNRTDRERWRTATTLPALGELYAEFLEGHLPDAPGWYGSGPDPETEPLVPTLAALNRAGYVTVESQPGDYASSPRGDRVWRQRAGVEGFADSLTLEWLAAALAGTDYLMIVQTTQARGGSADPREINLNQGIAVTTRNGQPVTWYGRQLTRRFMRAELFGRHLCGAALDILAAAWHVTIVDPVWDRNTLWPVLERATNPQPLTAAGRDYHLARLAPLDAAACPVS
jgi:hypothetical protein